MMETSVSSAPSVTHESARHVRSPKMSVRTAGASSHFVSPVALYTYFIMPKLSLSLSLTSSLLCVCVAGLPVIPENCPACFEGPKERYRIKTLLAQQEHLFPGLVGNLLRAMRPLMQGDTLHLRHSGEAIDED